MTFSDGATTVTFDNRNGPRPPIQIEPNHWDAQHELGGGSLSTTDLNVTVYLVKLEFQMDWAKWAELEEFLREDIRWRTESFTATPDVGWTFGSGQGVAVTANLFNKPGITQLSADLLQVSLVLRTYATGTGLPS